MWHQISANKRQSSIVLFFMLVLLGVFGAAVGYYIGETVEIALGSAAVLFIVFFVLLRKAKNNPTGFLLGDKVYQYYKEMDPKLYNIVEEMCIASGLKAIPQIYLMDTDVPNAFACGMSPENSSICVTKGLLEILDRDELQGVIAHEIAHIVNRDTTYLLYAGIIVTLITCITRGISRSSGRRSSSSSSGGGAIILLIVIIAIVLAPLISYLFYMSLSRKREYLADACAAQFTRYPAGLARALKKISTTVAITTCDITDPCDVAAFDETFEDGSANWDTNYNYNYNKNDFEFKEDPFLNASFIVPLQKRREKDGLFSTHPATNNRIRILLAMSGADYNAYNVAFCKVTRKSGVINAADARACKKTDIITPAISAVATSAVHTGDVTTTPQETRLEEKIERRRDAEDLMWKHAGYSFVNCLCGTKLKFPPSYKGQEIICPHCKTKHIVT